MKKTQKDSVSRTVLIAIFVLFLISGVYAYQQKRQTNKLNSSKEDKKMEDLSTSNSNSIITFDVSENTLSVINQGNIIQTISLDHDAVNAFEVIPRDFDKFITNLDINFDGLNDVGVFTSTGYAGVNNYYDFYIYNLQTKKLERSQILNQISNPVLDQDTKQLKSNYRSGPRWYTDTYQFNGTTYTKVSDGVGQ